MVKRGENMEKIIINCELIKKYMEKNNLSPKQFCKKCEISYYSYLKIMKNTITKFRPLYNISVIINVTMKDLIGF